MDVGVTEGLGYCKMKRLSHPPPPYLTYLPFEQLLLIIIVYLGS